MINLNETLIIGEVPCLGEIQKYLPIDPIDEEDVNGYISNILSLININYKYSQYQFAYFGVHLLYMTYIYCSVWKISKFNPERYRDSTLFARVYSGKDMDFQNIKSIFQYSYVPEKDVAKFFSIIDLDDAQIGKVETLVNKRNNMAHASGKFELLTEEEFKFGISSIHSSMKNIHKCMDKQIRELYYQIIIDYAKGIYDNDYSEIRDIIYFEIVQNYNLSINEILICKEASIRKYIDNYKEYGIIDEQKERLTEFKEVMEKFCDENGYC